MNFWILILIIGALTLVERLSFIMILGNWQMPNILIRGLKYVPVTVMLAIASPAVLRTDGMGDIALTNPKLIGALVAIVVAWRTKSILFTIAAGMLGLWISQLVLS